MVGAGACRLFLLLTVPYGLFCETGIWNANAINTFMFLSNFAYLTVSNGFQSVSCRLLDLSLLYLKAGNSQVLKWQEKVENSHFDDFEPPVHFKAAS